MVNSTLFCSVREQKGGVVAGMQCMGKVVWVFAFFVFFWFFLVVEIVSHFRNYNPIFPVEKEN